MNAKRTAKEAVRDTLKRLFRRASSHALPREVLSPLARAGKDGVVGCDFPAPGAAESTWQTHVSVATVSGMNTAPATVLSVDAGRSIPIYGLTLPTRQGMAARNVALCTGRTTHAVAVGAVSTPSQGTSAKLHPPPVRYLACAPPLLERGRGVRKVSCAMGKRRVLDGLRVLMERVPLVRERLGAPAGMDSAAWHRMARARLASASGADVDDVVLAGVYPRVPVTRVRQMAVGDGGKNLRLWLRPRSSERASPRFWTVTLGRLRSTGRVVQAMTEDEAGRREPDKPC